MLRCNQQALVCVCVCVYSSHLTVIIFIVQVFDSSPNPPTSTNLIPWQGPGKRVDTISQLSTETVMPQNLHQGGKEAQRDPCWHQVRPEHPLGRLLPHVLQTPVSRP